MNLFLRHDLFKNIVTIDGQKYDVSDEQKEGYEAYQATDGSTKYRKLVGQGAPSETPDKGKGPATGEEKAPVKKEEPKNIDPLKAGQPESQKPVKPSMDEAKKLQEKPKPPPVPKPLEVGTHETEGGGLSPFKPTPYTMDANAHKDTDPMEHYHAANLADKLGDKKMAQFHREQAQKKVLESATSQEGDIAVALADAGYMEDAVAVHAGLKDRLSRSEDIKDLKTARREDDLKDGAPKILDEMSTDERGAALDKQAEKLGVKAVADRIEADEKHAQLKEKFNSADDKLSAARKEAQDKVTGQFEEKSKEYEDSKAAYEKESKDYEAALEEHAASQSELKEKLQATSEKLKAVKEGKPVRDDSEERQHMDNYNAAAKKVREHSRKQPDDSKVKEAGNKLRDLKTSEKAKIKSAQEEHKAKLKSAQEAHDKATEEHGKVTEKLQGDHDKAVAEHTKTAEKLKSEYESVKSKAPTRPKNKEEQGKYESAMQAHKKSVDAAKKKLDEHKANKKDIDAAKKKLDDHKSKAPDKAKLKKLKDDLSSKMDKMKSESDKKISAATAQHNTLKDAHAAKVKEHRETGAKLNAEAMQHKEKASKARDKSQAEHEKKMGDWKNKVDAAKKDADSVKASKKDLPEKPQKPKSKEPQQTHKKPESREEKMAHSDHTKAAQQHLDNIESHLKNRTDLTPEAKQRLTELHSQASELAAQEHVPTKEDSKMLRDIGSRVKEHGSHQSFDDHKAGQDAQAAKQAAQDQKAQDKQAKEDSKKARKPANEVEEAQLSDHKAKMEEKVNTLREHLESGDVSDEDRKHIENAISHYEQESQRDTLPGQDEAKATKDMDKIMSRHEKEAKSAAKADEATPQPSKEAQPTSSSKQSARSRGTSLLQAWNRGGQIGSKIATTAYSPSSAGELTSMVDYAGGGAIRIGHALLNPRGKK